MKIIGLFARLKPYIDIFTNGAQQFKETLNYIYSTVIQQLEQHNNIFTTTIQQFKEITTYSPTEFICKILSRDGTLGMRVFKLTDVSVRIACQIFDRGQKAGLLHFGYAADKLMFMHLEDEISRKKPEQMTEFKNMPCFDFLRSWMKEIESTEQEKYSRTH